MFSKIPACPSCGSTDVKTTDDYKAKAGANAFGRIALGQVFGVMLGNPLMGKIVARTATQDNKPVREYQCKHCGMVWRIEIPAIQEVPKEPEDENNIIERVSLLIYSFNGDADIEETTSIGTIIPQDDHTISEFKTSLEEEFEISIEEPFNAGMTVEDIVNVIRKSMGLECLAPSVQATTAKDEKDYLEMYQEYAADGEVSPRDRKFLEKFRIRCGISEQRAQELEASFFDSWITDDEQEYLAVYNECVTDGDISEKDRLMLDKMREKLGISKARARALESM